MTISEIAEDVETLTQRRGRLCLILSLPGCPPCAQLKAAIVERVSDAELERIFEIQLDALENREHRSFIRANGVTGFPTVQLYEDGTQAWSSAWVFGDAVLDRLLDWLFERDPALDLPAPASKSDMNAASPKA